MKKRGSTIFLRFFLSSLAILFLGGYLGCGWLEREDVLMEFRFIPDTFDARHKSACLEYTLAEEVSVSIAIYNSTGERVVQLVDSQYKTKGKHIYEWDGKDAKGDYVPPGLYIAYIKAGDEKAEVTFSIIYD